MIEVLLVAPYASVLAGLRALLSEAPGISVAVEARDVSTVEYLIGSHLPDVLVYDASTDALESLLQALGDREIPIVALGDDPADAALLARRRAGAWSALRRSADGQEIAAGIHAAAAGIIALDAAHAAELFDGADFAQGAVAADGEEITLTARESEVLQLMTHGLPNKNIAARLHISLSTAKFHVASILTKLDASSRTEAVTIAARRGLVTL